MGVGTVAILDTVCFVGGKISSTNKNTSETHKPTHRPNLAKHRPKHPSTDPLSVSHLPWKGQSMIIEVWSLDRVKPYPNNPRVNDDAVDAVAASIREFGFRQPIVVDNDGVIICGHTRFKAAQKLGLNEAPVTVAKDLSPEQIKAYRIADNKTAELADWNYDLLPIELGDLQTNGFDLSLLGFEDDELLKLLKTDVEEGVSP